MSKPRVMLDINILIFGLVFRGGNEHKILGLVERGSLRLVLPEFVVWETKKILRDKFSGYEALMDLFLSHVDYEEISWSSIEEALKEVNGVLRDVKDTPILASILFAGPDYTVTGDKGLRDDLNSYLGSSKVYSSADFLGTLEKGCAE
jgi:predicted nucleic acid-binding protein